MTILMAGGNTGILAFLTVKPDVVVSYTQNLTDMADYFKVLVLDSIYQLSLSHNDTLLSVHGREIVPKAMLDKVGRALNVHPYLYCYKGKDPIGRALMDRNFNASVGVHKMTEKLDSGEVLYEKCIKLRECDSVIEIYNQLYPYYPEVIMEGLKRYKENEFCGCEEPFYSKFKVYCRRCHKNIKPKEKSKKLVKPPYLRAVDVMPVDDIIDNRNKINEIVDRINETH